MLILSEAGNAAHYPSAVRDLSANTVCLRAPCGGRFFRRRDHLRGRCGTAAAGRQAVGADPPCGAVPANPAHSCNIQAKGGLTDSCLSAYKLILTVQDMGSTSLFTNIKLQPLCKIKKPFPVFISILGQLWLGNVALIFHQKLFIQW